MARLALVAVLTCLAAPSPALAWYKHQALMPMVLGAKSLADARLLVTQMPASCGGDYAATLAALVKSLALNPAIARAPSPFEAACREARPITGAEILTGPSIDEPDDSGMDENLPAAADPAGDRPWLGGETGPSSKGFRHFYFGGWSVRQPLASIQVPLMREIGLAPERAALTGSRARAALRAGPAYEAWGFRLLMWSLHYLQDLTQPFHASEYLSLELLPWRHLLTWPSLREAEPLRLDMERITTNYHWAVEGYVLARAKEGADSPWHDCLSNPSAYWTIPSDLPGAEPRAGDEPAKTAQLAHVARGIAWESRELAGELGSRLPAFFGSELKSPGASMPLGTVRVDYAALAIRPDLDRERAAVHETLCKSLANTAWVTGWLLHWAERP